MALQQFLSQLRHRGIGNSSAVRSMNTYTSGRKRSGAARELLRTGDAAKLGSRTKLLKGDRAKEFILGQANGIVFMSLVCVAVRRGDETLALGSGTIIRSDGIVAASASPLSLLKIKELQVTVNVMVMWTEEIYEAVLLDADFCSNIALLKFSSPRQLDVPEFSDFDNEYQGLRVVAAGCNRRCDDLRNAEVGYSLGKFGSVANKVEKAVSPAETSGQIIRAEVDRIAPFIGGPLLDPFAGVYGVIHKEVSGQIEATPMVDILKYLDHVEKHGETS